MKKAVAIITVVVTVGLAASGREPQSAREPPEPREPPDPNPENLENLENLEHRDLAWPINGGVDNIRYSPLTQINRENVSRLKVAWTYDSHDAFKASEMQSNPVVVDGVLFVTTPTLKVVAVNAATGAEIWRFDPSGGAAPGARFRHRGVTVHKDRVFVSYRSYLYALDRKTGTPIAVVRIRRADRPARGARHAGGETQRQREHAGRRVRGHADHGQLGAGDHSRARPGTSAPST